MKRYQEQGLAGLQVKPGRGRKAILSQDTDLAAVRLAVQNNRQRVSLAKAELHRTSPNFTELHRTSAAAWQGVLHAHPEAVPEKNGCRFKRVRRQVKHKPNSDVYEFKRVRVQA